MAAAARGTARSGGADKPWADAIRIAANRPGQDGKKMLAVIAEKVVDAAAAGDLVAAKEVGDRLDGKAKQQVDLGGDGLASLAEAIMAARARRRA